MKTLREIIKEYKQYITTNNICYCSGGIVCGRYKISKLSEYELNKKYYPRDCFIEDNELCVKY